MGAGTRMGTRAPGQCMKKYEANKAKHNVSRVTSPLLFHTARNHLNKSSCPWLKKTQYLSLFVYLEGSSYLKYVWIRLVLQCSYHIVGNCSLKLSHFNFSLMAFDLVQYSNYTACQVSERSFKYRMRILCGLSWNQNHLNCMLTGRIKRALKKKQGLPSKSLGGLDSLQTGPLLSKRKESAKGRE